MAETETDCKEDDDKITCLLAEKGEGAGQGRSQIIRRQDMSSLHHSIKSGPSQPSCFSPWRIENTIDNSAHCTVFCSVYGILFHFMQMQANALEKERKGTS
jgi:hypothetical protein